MLENGCAGGPRTHFFPWFGQSVRISHQTALRWIKKAQSLLGIVTSLVPAEKNDVLELDELWSFVCKKVQKRWVWIALCRRTRQVVS
ncbi:MAG: hypothetical protein J0L94_12180, partial [Rhodothermia bacterium]|nr:hypothetical protein [Rhodothermia bacterium]